MQLCVANALPLLVGLYWRGGDRTGHSSASRVAFLYWRVFCSYSLCATRTFHVPIRKWIKRVCQAQLQTDNKNNTRNKMQSGELAGFVRMLQVQGENISQYALVN